MKVIQKGEKIFGVIVIVFLDFFFFQIPPEICLWFQMSLFKYIF